MSSTRLFLSALLAALCVSLPAFALDLQSAKSSGKVGETITGYIAPVGTASGVVSALVADVNSKRRLEYQRISQENGQPASVVEKLAAEKLIGRLAPGELYQSASGEWKKK